MSMQLLFQGVCAQDTTTTDGHLLDRFLTHRDETAFALLLKRHGPMVLGLCRRLLRNESDAEEAFQAAFLVLILKARTLTGRAMLGDWLHVVARHTALKARTAAARRREKEQTAARSEPALPDARQDELLPRLD